MKIELASDLHIEWWDAKFPEEQVFRPEERDILVLAGDISDSHNGYALASRQAQFTPVIYIPGNHEFYGWDMSVWHQRLMKMHASYAGKYPLYIPTTLDHAEVTTIGDVCFHFNTMWTRQSTDPLLNWDIQRNITDYREIRLDGPRIRPETIDELHRSFIDSLAIEPGMKNVVVTHHLPVGVCIGDEYKTSRYNSAYCAHVSDEIMSSVDLWLYGHTHIASDLMYGNTRLVCNPYGYENHERRWSDGCYSAKIIEL